MTDPTPTAEQSNSSSPQKSSGVTISRRALAVGGAILLVILVVAAVAVGFALGARTSVASGAAEHSSEARPSAVSTPAPARSATQPAPPPEPVVETHNVGETFTTGNVTLSVNSFDAVDSIETTDGEPITADPGGQLFLVKMTYSNSKNQADLSCGNTDLYLQAFDSQQREMAPVFELYRLPGNPECNNHLLQNTPQEWSYIFQSVSGATPLAMSVTETEKFTDPVWVNLR